MIDRRKLLFALGAGALAAPFASLAQQPGKVWRVGFLSTRDRPVSFETDAQIGAFLRRMAELGYVVGKNLEFEWRFTGGNGARLPEFATDLVKLNVDVIVVQASPATSAAQKATSTIPIVFIGLGDPVLSGFAKSLARPGGNITGVSLMAAELRPKLIGLMLELAPKTSRLAVLMNPYNRAHITSEEIINAAARARNIKIVRADAQTPAEIDNAFALMRREKADALMVSPDPVFRENENQIIGLAAKQRLPSIAFYREYAEVGGLLSYGPDRDNLNRRAAMYLDKIFKGAHPADLPIEQPTQFELVINRKTAKALGLPIPQSLLISADKVIE